MSEQISHSMRERAQLAFARSQIESRNEGETHEHKTKQLTAALLTVAATELTAQADDMASETLSATQSKIGGRAVDHQPAGRAGPNNAPTKLLLFMYQIPVCAPPWSTKSGCPSPLKSPSPATNQPAG